MREKLELPSCKFKCVNGVQMIFDPKKYIISYAIKIKIVSNDFSELQVVFVEFICSYFYN